MSRFVPVRAVRAQPPSVVELDPAPRCPYCKSAVEPEQELVACGGCQTVLHAECSKAGCTTLGCGGAATREPGPSRWAPAGQRIRFVPPPPRRRVRWTRVGAVALLLSGVGLLAGGQGLWRGEESLAAPSHRPLRSFPPVVEVPLAPPAEAPAHAPPVSLPTGHVVPPGWTVRAIPGQLPALGALIEVRGDLVFVRGRLDQPGTLTLEGPNGESVSWAHRPGRFEGALTWAVTDLRDRWSSFMRPIRVHFTATDGGAFADEFLVLVGG